MKRTRQKELILSNLRGRTDHPTAEDVYTALKPGCPGLSLATVYRNLNCFCEAGLAVRLPSAGKDRFDGNVEPHCHFVCERCGELTDIFSDAPMQLARKVERESGCRIKSEIVVLHGICKTCR